MRCSILILACRSLEKCEHAKQDILNTFPETQRPKTQIVCIPLEMSSFQSIVQFGENCKSLPRLDAVVLNAGVQPLKFSLTEGFETTIAINVVSTFLVATLLLPKLRETAQKHATTPTIAVVGSAVHFWCNSKDLTSPPAGQIFTTLSDQKKTKMEERYYLSKLPVMLLVRYLSKILEKQAKSDPQEKPLVIINNVAPGLCKTGLFRDDDRFALKAALTVMGRTSEQGARTLVHGVLAGKGSNGQYLSECQIKKASPFVNSAEGDVTAEKIWKELVAVYEKVQPGCTSVW